MPGYAGNLDVFQPALPMRGVTEGGIRFPPSFPFQPALPMRGVTGGVDIRPLEGLISTRTPHAGSDAGTAKSLGYKPYFNPHSPCGE